MKAAAYDKILASRAEGRVSYRRVEGVINSLQVYRPDPRDDGVNRYLCTPELVLRDCERGEIVPMDKKRGPKKPRSGYAPTKEKIKGDNNNDDDNNEAMDDTDPDSKATRRMAWDIMWENRGPGVCAPDYREKYNLKDAEWSLNTVPQITDGMNVSNYIYPDIDLKLR